MGHLLSKLIGVRTNSEEDGSGDDQEGKKGRTLSPEPVQDVPVEHERNIADIDSSGTKDIFYLLFHRKESVLDFAEKILGKPLNGEPLTDSDINLLDKHLSGIRIEGNYFSKTYHHWVKNVTKESARDIRKNFISGEVLTEKTVEEIFSLKGSPVQLPLLPCLHMKTKSNFIFVPLEFCSILDGQPRGGMLEGPFATYKIRESCLRCKEQFIIKSEYLGDENCHLIVGRKIPPPYILYGGDMQVSFPNSQGLWSMANISFIKPMKDAISWSILSILPKAECSIIMLEKFADKLMQYMVIFGMEVQNVTSVKILDSETSIYDELNSLKNSVKLAVVVLDPDSEHYFDLKESADFDNKLVTQCVTGISLKVILKNEVPLAEMTEIKDKVGDAGLAKSYLYSMCMNINTKLGGTNHQIRSSSPILNESAVIMGAYVSTPDKNDPFPPIAAVLGCQNSNSTRYVSSCRAQQIPRDAEERKRSFEIQKLDEMTHYVLKTFSSFPNATKPTRIIYLRNGVRLEDYKSVLQKEIAMIKKGCADEFKDVALTYIMVTKEHGTSIEKADGRRIASTDLPEENGQLITGDSADSSDANRKSQDNGKNGTEDSSESVEIKKEPDELVKLENSPVKKGKTSKFDISATRIPDAGSAIDSLFVHPQFFDFFISSQGNSKSALYTVMYDESNVNAEQIENLCFHLCFLYSKCSRSISYPAPVTYARTIVGKARKYIKSKTEKPTYDEADKLLVAFQNREDMLLV